MTNTSPVLSPNVIAAAVRSQAPDLSATSINPADPAYMPLLEDLQGDILKANGRLFATHIVFSFIGPPAKVKVWLSQLAATYLTSAARQIAEAAAHRLTHVDAGIFGTVGLTAAAYQWLGFDLAHIPRDRQARFLAGMTDSGTQALLNDPPVQCLDAWSQGTQAPVHAVLNLFNNTEAGLTSAVATITAGAAGLATLLTVQTARRLFNAARQPIEPFGFQDGVSQPLFYAQDIPQNLPPGAYDPSAPLSLVLLADPNGANPYSCGSFLVYRKLKQDTVGFQNDVTALASKLSIDPKLAGAYAMGRFQDGTPVIDSDHPTGAPLVDNTFQFASDANAARCPFQAHIRKANPRGDTVRSNGAPLDVERGHRIVRRAFSFVDPAEGTGLHFFCYQSDIGNQFEFIQSAWANMAHFSRMDTGLDPVIGQAGSGSLCTRPATVPTPQPWPNVWDDGGKGTTPMDFGRWVSLKGGAYLFAPSLSFFAILGK